MLVKCPSCNKEVSKNAESCPHCGEPLKKTKKPRQNIGCLGGFFIIVFFLFIAGQCNKQTSVTTPSSTSTAKKHPPKIKTAEEMRLERLSGCFSGWDGSHRETTALIKKAMNDPDSYQHDETKYVDNGDHLVIISSFRGKNAFGGVVKNWIKVKTDIETCKIIDVLGEGP